MIRREFLVRTLSAAVASLVGRDALAQQNAHDMHDMSGMSGMQGMPQMPQMPVAANVTTTTTRAAASLAASDALPAGAPLPTLRALANQSREAGVFRATLIAQPFEQTLIPGKPTTFWLYDQPDRHPQSSVLQGPIVGPLIDVREGDRVEIRFVNHLPQPSTIHWHGLPVPPDQDGNPSDPVAPGQSRVYRFTLPPGSAGTYWYHPHPHMLSAEQVFRGLAGPIVVRAATDPLAGWPERHLFFSDLRLANDGTIPPDDMLDWMNGREGQFVLVNGVRRPLIVVTQDERWRVSNGCNARYLRLSFGDACQFAQVGTDGGLLTAARDGLTELLLAPGERAELVVSARGQPVPHDGRSVQAVLSALSYDRRKMAMSHGSLPPDAALALADVRFELSPADDQAWLARRIPAQLRTIAPLDLPTADKAVRFSEKMDMAAMHHAGASSGNSAGTSGGAPSNVSAARPVGTIPAGMAFMINGASFDPQRITLTSRRGEVERWSIENGTDMDHPFHLHGTQFQVLEREQGGVVTPEPDLAWRDTVNVQPGETVRIATVQQQAGLRMFHCHILEHEDLGMMGTLKVIEAGA
jgi:bilirubin oxidase